MKLIPELLNSSFYDNSEFNAIFNAHGLYNTEQFVLRLSPKNHILIDQIEDPEFDQKNIDDSTLQAYSTYIHETIHWWKHIGSTAGFVLSLCYPLQTHSNINLIVEWCKLGAAKKSIKSEAKKGELEGRTHDDPRQATSNSIVNNTMDFEFYKQWVLKPDLSVKICKDPYFESQGHCFHIVYANLLSILADLIDPSGKIITGYKNWEKEFQRLTNERVMGYYYGSPLYRRRVGIIELFEGQACFSQMQFLANSRKSGCEIEHFKSVGMLHGVYEKAFCEFLILSELEYPTSILEPTIGLFLLICDLSINPMEGFPCDIPDFEQFVNHADPGIRFELLCRAVSSLEEDISLLIKDYSKNEYFEISSILLRNAGLLSLSDGWQVINSWLKSSPELQSIMKEHSEFKFNSESTVMRVIISSFVSFTLDKQNNPEFFCWPGFWKANRTVDDKIEELWIRNLSMFSDKEDDDGIFIRNFPGKSKENSLNTLNSFFGNNLIYNLSRQWVLKDGQFDFDFSWLSESITKDDWEKWADKVFERQYGIKISDIQIDK